MKSLIIAFFFCFTLVASFGQSDSNWVMFIDKSTNLIGYKNLKGDVKIEPKFTYLTQQNIFRNIMPVYEQSPTNADSIFQYYLLKDGGKVGTDSLYVGDYFLDCESENKIRFRDHLTGKVGFFNNRGQVIIPAIYNDATSFNNGLALVIKDGKRICPDGMEYTKENPCEHFRWEGNQLLINNENEVLLENIKPGNFENLDLYSMVINPEKKSAGFIDFKSSDGNIYSFLDLKKEFEFWLNNKFLPNKKSGNFADYFFPEITIPKETEFQSQKFFDPKYADYAWTVDDKKNVLDKNKSLLNKILENVNNKNYLTSITKGNAPILLDKDLYQQYFSDCGDYLGLKYPYFEVMVTNNNGLVLNGLGFIRTREGYKLVEVY